MGYDAVRDFHVPHKAAAKAFQVYAISCFSRELLFAHRAHDAGHQIVCLEHDKGDAFLIGVGNRDYAIYGKGFIKIRLIGAEFIFRECLKQTACIDGNAFFIVYFSGWAVHNQKERKSTREQ